MALQKEITLNNGVKVNYYRIAGFAKYGDRVTTDVLYYVDNTYREKEIEFNASEEHFFENNNRLSELYNIPEEDKTTEIIEEIASLEDWNIKFQEITSGGGFHVVSGSYEVLIQDNDFSIKRIYDLLKETDVFQGAIDC